MVVFVGPGRRSQSAAGRQCVLGTAATAAGHRRVLGTTATMSGRRCVLRSTAGYTQPQLSARRLAVNSARAGKLGRKRCRSATERATAISERLRLTIRSRAAVGGCECSQAILLASYATTWPRRSCLFVSRFLGSIAGDHRLTRPFFAGGRVTYRQYLHKVATSTCGGRAVASSSRGFHASSSGSFVPLAGKRAVPGSARV